MPAAKQATTTPNLPNKLARLGYLRPLRTPRVPTPCVQVLCGLSSFPIFPWLPTDYGMGHDALPCPRTHRCGGAIAIFCPRTLRYHAHGVHTLLRLDNSYTAELYTAWMALSAHGTAAEPTFIF